MELSAHPSCEATSVCVGVQSVAYHVGYCHCGFEASSFVFDYYYIYSGCRYSIVCQLLSMCERFSVDLVECTKSDTVVVHNMLFDTITSNLLLHDCRILRPS